jgi:DNA repair ATPase RecN
MRLRHLQLENFRAFRNAEIRFPGTGLVLVTGPNNAGKTALLSSLDVLAGISGDLTSLRHGGSQEPARVLGTFDLDEAERAAILQNARGGQWLLDAGVLSVSSLYTSNGKTRGCCFVRCRQAGVFAKRSKERIPPSPPPGRTGRGD